MIMVLCFYRVWSAYRLYGSASGAKMIHVSSLDDISKEFDLQMRAAAKLGPKFFGIERPHTWVLEAALLRDGTVIKAERVFDVDDDQISI